MRDLICLNQDNFDSYPYNETTPYNLNFSDLNSSDLNPNTTFGSRYINGFTLYRSTNYYSSNETGYPSDPTNASSEDRAYEVMISKIQEEA